MTAHLDALQQARTQRVAALLPYGFTPRQADFLATVMVHSGLCVQRQYCDYAGIAFGQVVQDFFAALTARRFATAYPCAKRGSQILHIHRKNLYAAIGQPDNRNRRPATAARAVERLAVLDVVISRPDLTWLGTEAEKLAYCVDQRQLGLADLPSIRFKSARGETIRYFPDKLPLGVSPSGKEITFVYVVTDADSKRLREFIDRHRPVLTRLLPWTFLLAVPRAMVEGVKAHRAVLTDVFAPPVRPAVVEEFRWYCLARHAFEQGPNNGVRPDPDRFTRARRAFAAPRFFAAYRRWRRDGDVTLHHLLSPTLHEAHRQGNARVDTVLLPHAYAHLSAIVQTA